MNKIEIAVLNPDAVKNAEKMTAFCARLTQRGHKIKDMTDLKTLYEKDCSEGLLTALTKLPHPTIQKFGVINVAVVGASRRFLAQITRHQNEVKFMSASLQYSDYSDEGDFVVPYDLLAMGGADVYLDACRAAMREYKIAVEAGIDHDAAGYIAPQGLRNILIISATPYQWKHMISQRSCRRNTKETAYVMLKIWEELYKLSPLLFDPATTGPGCMKGKCLEGKMCCGKAINKNYTPDRILAEDFPLLVKEEALV